MSQVDPASFTRAMRRFPTGVAVVTSRKDGRPRGMTLNSFTSVAAQPPMVLICVNREARSYLYIATSAAFCVNLLAVEQRDLAEHFSGRVRDRQFEHIPYVTAATGAPVLPGALAFFDCTVIDERIVASHSIFVGQVAACDTRDGTPLGYLNGAARDFGVTVE
ncbi:MAG: flavin reductase family protein [Vulcanimicrobiaceae bacterium]